MMAPTFRLSSAQRPTGPTSARASLCQPWGHGAEHDTRPLAGRTPGRQTTRWFSKCGEMQHLRLTVSTVQGTRQWHSVCSHRGVTVTTIHLQNFPSSST